MYLFNPIYAPPVIEASMFTVVEKKKRFM